MKSDLNLIFTGGNLAAQVPLGVDMPSTGVLDLAAGAMLDTSTVTTYAACPMIIGNATVFGEDLGIGDEKLPLAVFLGGTNWAGGTSLNIAIQGAVDASGGTYPANLSGLTWTTYAESGPQLTAQLLANRKFPMPDWPHRAIGAALPRFIRLLYDVTGTFSGGGSIAFAGFVLQRPDNPVGQYPSGFTVAP